MSKFADVLRDAVADMLRHGYSDRDRLDAWLERLRRAAADSLIPETTLQRHLTGSLSRVYARFVGKAGHRRRHPGLNAYTLAQLEPSLRTELNRRIMASAQLIRLNRVDAIATTLRRFEGWATAIPAGGTSATTKTEEVAELRKAFASLPFRERRVVVDQGHKLISAVSSITAEYAGAIAAVWHSHWREAGYDYRPAHKRLDQGVYLLRDSQAVKDGLVRKSPGVPFADEIEAPAQLPFCRCYYSYIYDLEDLPESVVTAKGRLAIKTRENRHAQAG